jgi:hypothetical protein
MTPLAFPFDRAGYRHDLVQRSGRVCLVQRTSTRPDSRGHVHWEVVILCQYKERPSPRGTILPAVESYPPTTAWGTHGWTYASLAEASERYRHLLSPQPGSHAARRPLPRAYPRPSQRLVG